MVWVGLGLGWGGTLLLLMGCCSHVGAPKDKLSRALGERLGSWIGPPLQLHDDEVTAAVNALHRCDEIMAGH